MNTLLLVDGSSYLYRAFHAMPDLRNKAGEPTGAIYGVLNMLRRLAQDYTAHYRACVFDAKGKTFRDDWYPQYKANRPPMPDDLARQIEPLHACIEALGWPLLMIDGVEADDVIGTLAREAVAQGVDRAVSTGDKDLAQLVDAHVKLVNTMSNETLDEAGVVAKFGVPPERIVDYLALVGDSVDNVPGVDKVGPKTAVKWLHQYGSLDQIVAHADEIGGVVGENLRRATGFLPLARKLVTVVCDLELPLHLADLEPRSADGERLAELFAQLEFKTWLRELQAPASAAAASDPPPAAAPAPDGPHGSTRRSSTWEQFDAWLARIEAAELTALDTETTSLDPMPAELVGMSFAVAPGVAAYLPLGHRYAGAPAQLERELAIARLRALARIAAPRQARPEPQVRQARPRQPRRRARGIAHDTLLESYVLESDKGHDMDTLAARHLDLKTISYDEVTGKGAARIGFEQVAVERATEYAAEDADVTLRLHQALYPRLAEEAGSSASIARSKCRCSKCCSPWSATACCSTSSCSRARATNSARACWSSKRRRTTWPSSRST